MKRILFIMPGLPGGGAEKVLVEILKRIDYSEYKVTLLLSQLEGELTEDVPSEVELRYIHKKKSIYRERVHRYLWEHGQNVKFYEVYHRRRVRWILRHRLFDSIVSFMEGEAVRLHSYIFDKGKRHLSWVHIDLKNKHWSSSWFNNDEEEKKIYERMDGISFVSEETQMRFEELFDYRKNNIKVIYNIIDRNEIISKANRFEVPGSKFRICMIGRLNPQKRYDRAIDIAVRLRDDGYDFELMIIGEGELRHELELRVATYGLEDYVRFEGFKKNPYPYLKSSDIYLSTSASEGFSLTLCEAMCLGIPCVSTKTSGPRELLQDGKYGIVTNHDIESIERAVKNFMDNPSKCAEYSNKAKERSAIFNPGATINQVLKFINGIENEQERN